MKELEFVANRFDLRKFKKICNVKGCRKVPSKEILIFELDLRTLRKRELVSIYLCGQHSNTKTIKNMIKELNNICDKGKIIDRKNIDIGIVTY